MRPVRRRLVPLTEPTLGSGRAAVELRGIDDVLVGHSETVPDGGTGCADARPMATTVSDTAGCLAPPS